MKLRNLLAFFAPQLREAQKCAACGQPFHCGASLAGCWCAEIQVSDAARAELQKKYQGCLCRECLEKAAASAAGL